MVELRGVRQVAGGVEILHETSLRFRRGAFNVVLGPNGAGKSTLLRIATGLLAPTSGVALLEDRPIRGIPRDELARRRAVLSQHVDLAFPLPVRDVVLMGRYPHYGARPTARDLQIVDEALALVDMQHKATQAYPTLSGGEQQKVQLARVLAQIWRSGDAAGGESGHRYLFLDEPTSSLDVHYQLQLLDVARGLLARDCTVIAVLHDLNMAFSYADHVVLLESGRVAYEGEHGEAIQRELLERVFRVKAHRVQDPAERGGFWRFSL